MPAEALFYHLERQPLENVLPTLLERTLERGWRAVVEAGTPDRLEALNQWLWTYKPESFLGHGTKADGHSAAQPIYLTTDADNPNGAKVRFFVDGATPHSFDAYDRLVVMFDGRDTDAVAAARVAWKAAKAAGSTATYWQQNAEGRWEKKA
ncbi:MAG: DNA polymerase III subunit chi [Hyphomicrobiaceae bacterium]